MESVVTKAVQIIKDKRHVESAVAELNEDLWLNVPSSAVQVPDQLSGRLDIGELIIINGRQLGVLCNHHFRHENLDFSYRLQKR